MAHVKAGGTARNIHDSPGQRLGLKVTAGQRVGTGQVLVRQTGLSKRAGKGTFVSRNYTIHAARDGQVSFSRRRVRRFDGRAVSRTEVIVQ